MAENLFSDIEETHCHEETLRLESMALINADPELSRRLDIIQKAMALIFGYTIDHTSSSEEEATIQLLGVRLFNAAASGIKLALSGYYQTHSNRPGTSWRPATCSTISAPHPHNASHGSSQTEARAGGSLIQ